MQPPAEEVLHGWGMAHSARSLVYRPRSEDEVAEALVDARGRGLTVTARGAGLSYGDAALNEGGAVLELGALEDISSFDAATGLVRAQAGVTIGDLWRCSIGSGWWPPVVPGTMKATLGGCVAMDVHGKNHAQAGSIGRHVRALRVVRSDGTIEDLEGQGLTEVIGAQGLTGIVVEVALQLTRVRTGYLDVEVRATRGLDETFEALDRGAAEADYAVAWIDCTGRHAGHGVFHQASYLPPEHPLTRRGLLEEAQELPRRVAGVLPRRHAWLALRPFMSRVGIRVLNRGKYALAALRGRRRYTQSHAAFHFLLDTIPGWKRAYGPNGLIQYQLFVPTESARAAFAEAIRQQRELGVPSYLGVLKRHAEERSAARYHLDGYSLALDFPAGRGEKHKRLLRLCAALDEIVAEAGGRIYAAKDGVSRGRLPESRDPAFSSNLVRRWEG